MRVFFIMILFLIMNFVNAQNHDNSSIEGIYTEPGSYSGLKVEKLPNGNYHFIKIENYYGKIVPAEWQTAYVIKTNDNSYIFYWHTGRQNGGPETNDLIVYELRSTGNSLKGYYIVPTNPDYPKSPIEFFKSK